MAKKAKKSRFAGIRLTEEQEGLIVRLKEAHGYKSQTDVLLNGLESLAAKLSLSPGAGFTAKLGLLPSTGTSQDEQKEQEVMTKVVSVVSKIDEIVDKHQRDRSALIQILLEVQREYRWLPKEALLWLSQRLDVPLNQIYQIATFYKAFNLIPRGRHVIRVCTGTACHVRGALTLLDRTTQILGIGAGETTKDMRFTLETVNCLGCCALGPVLLIDEDYHSNPPLSELERLLSSCQ